MLLGEYNHNIDEKGRLIIPAKLREGLGDSFVICNGLEGCLFVYSQEEWNKFVAELESLPRMNKDARMFKRYFFGSANEGSFDPGIMYKRSPFPGDREMDSWGVLILY